MPEKDVWNIAIKILKALKALHKMKIVHRDIKAANIFLCKNHNEKLTIQSEGET